MDCINETIYNILEKKMNTQLYTVAGSILKKSLAKKASLKTLIYESQFGNIPQLTAFASELIKHSALFEEIYSHTQENGFINEEIVEGKKEIALALLYEYLLGNKFGKNVALRKVMLRYKAEIKSAVDKVLSAHNVKYLRQLTRPKDSISNIKIPRYMRVNLIRSSPEDAIKLLQEEGWRFIGKIEFENFNEKVMSLKEDEFGLDPLLFDLLVFPAGTKFFNHYLTLSGILIHQDKASCIPAHVLNPAPGSVVLDSCAAPGNKSSHLISLMKDEGEVIAMDQDLKRMNMMSKMLEKISAKNVQLVHQDFLTVLPDSEDAKRIQFILVDPSCSGSGMLGVQQGRDIYDTDQERLQTLSRFQITILKHALQFPSVERVVYSTCSIHQEENEQVVEQAMSHFSDKFKFDVLFPDSNCNRGIDRYPHSKCFLRLSPENDLTQGFFVACFQRRKQKRRRGPEVNSDNAKIINLDIKRKIAELPDKMVNKSTKVSNLDNAEVDTSNSTVCLDFKKSKEKKKKKQKHKLPVDEQTLVDEPKEEKHKKDQSVNDSSINSSEESSEVNKKRKHKDISADNIYNKHDPCILEVDTSNSTVCLDFKKIKEKKKKKQKHKLPVDEQTLVDEPKEEKHKKDQSVISVNDSTINSSEESSEVNKKRKHKDISSDNIYNKHDPCITVHKNKKHKKQKK